MSLVTVTPTVELGNAPPRVRLDVVDSGTPAITEVTVIRHDSDGTSNIVRTVTGESLVLTTSGSNRVGLVYDYEAPYGTGVTYSTVEDAATVSAQVTLNEQRAWLVHPGVPELSRPVRIAALGARSRAAALSVYQPLGRRSPVVFHDGQRKSDQWEMSLLTESEDERLRLAAIFDDLSPLLLNVPAGAGWGFDAEYVSVGDVTEERVTRFIGNPLRMWSLPLTVVDRPIGGTQAERTYADLLSYSTYGELRGAYVDYQALLSGP